MNCKFTLDYYFICGIVIIVIKKLYMEMPMKSARETSSLTARQPTQIGKVPKLDR